MSSAVSIVADPAHQVGHALVRIVGVPRPSGPITFHLRRPEWTESNLGPGGWQVAAAALSPDSITTDGSNLMLGIGPAICVHLESTVYELGVPALGIDTSVYWPDIVPPHAGMSSFFEPPGVATTATAAPTPVPTPAPVATPAPKPASVTPPAPKTAAMAPAPEFQPVVAAPVQEPKAPAVAGRSRVGLWLVLGALLLAGGVGGYFAFLPGSSAPSIVTGAPQAIAPPAPANLDTMSVSGLVARNKPDEMFDQARKRLAANPQQALLLLESAGDERHYGPALALLAPIYDPNKPRQGGIPADARQSARYYRDAAANGDQSGAADREALRRSIVQRKNAGDLNAKLIEQDFWP